jgi:hypothetical protein
MKTYREKIPLSSKFLRYCKDPPVLDRFLLQARVCQAFDGIYCLLLVTRRFQTRIQGISTGPFTHEQIGRNVRYVAWPLQMKPHADESTWELNDLVSNS